MIICNLWHQSTTEEFIGLCFQTLKMVFNNMDQMFGKNRQECSFLYVYNFFTSLNNLFFYIIILWRHPFLSVQNVAHSSRWFMMVRWNGCSKFKFGTYLGMKHYRFLICILGGNCNCMNLADWHSIQYRAYDPWTFHIR